MAKRYLVIVLLCLVGLGVGLLLVPGDREIALMHMRDKDYDLALKQYEDQKAAGDLSVGTVGTLARLYLQYGDVEKAIVIMEEFVAAHPDNTEARQKLGQYYQYAQRPEDYLKNLEVLAKLDPKPEYLRELSDIYNYNSQYDAQEKTLQQLVQKGSDDETAHPEDAAKAAKELADLAKLQASLGKKDEAVASMKLLNERHPDHMGENEKALLLSLMVDSGASPEAVALAKGWAEKGDKNMVGVYARVIAGQGNPDAALELVHSFAQEAEDKPQELAGLLEAVVDIERLHGLDDQAYARLQRLYDKGVLPARLMPPALELAMARQNYAMADDLLDKADVAALPLPVLLDVAALGVSGQYPAFREKLAAKLDKETLSSQPALQAVMLLGEGNGQAFRAHVQGMKYADLNMDIRVRLARIFATNEQRAEALTVLRSIAAEDAAADTLLVDIAMAWVETREAAEGLRYMEAVQKLRNSPQAEYGWVLLAAADGRDKDVLAWLETDEKHASTRVLLDIFYVTREAGRDKLNLHVAELLYNREQTGRHSFNLADAYLRNGQPEKALPLVKALEGEWAGKAKKLYMSALTEMVTRKRLKGEELETARKELLGYFDAELAEASTTPARREEILYMLLRLKAYDRALPLLADAAEHDPAEWGGAYVEALLDAGRGRDAVAYINTALTSRKLPAKLKEQLVWVLAEKGNAAQALPYLKELAYAKGGTWIYAYEEALRKTGDTPAVHAFWRERALSAKTEVKDRRILAYKLLEAGDAETASRVFFALAEHAPTAGKDADELVYIWLNNPQFANPDWLEYRARLSTDEERGAWLAHLNTLREHMRVVNVVEQTSVPEARSAAVQDAYFEALFGIKDQAKLRNALEVAVDSEVQPTLLKKWAKRAREAGYNPLAKRAYQKLASAETPDAEVIRELAELEYYDGAHGAALAYYDRYMQMLDEVGQSAVAERDIEMRLQLGDIYKKRKEKEKARAEFVKVLEVVSADPNPSREARLARARALYSTDQYEAAQDAYEGMKASYPGDREVLTDYAEMLIMQKAYPWASKLLEEAGSLRQAQQSEGAPQSLMAGNAGIWEEADPFTTLRIELLSAQILYETGHIKQAAKGFEAAALKNPENAYPLISLADVETSAGHWQNAMQILARAEALTPQNEDIFRAREQILKYHGSALKVDVEWRDMEKAETGVITKVEGHVLTNKQHDKAGVSLARNDMKVKNITLPSGNVGTFDGEGYAAELYYEWYSEKTGHILRGGLLASDSGPGVALAYHVPDYGSITSFIAEYHRAYWEIPEGVMNEAARDMVAIRHYRDFSDRWYGVLQVGTNRYTIDGDDSVTDSASFEGNLAYRIRLAGPMVSLIYTLDAEYLYDEAEQRMGPNGLFRPFPLTSREVHSLGINATDRYGENLLWEAFAGYAVDRLEGSGPFVGGVLTYDINEALSGQLRALYSYNSRGVGGDAKRAGGYLNVRF